MVPNPFQAYGIHLTSFIDLEVTTHNGIAYKFYYMHNTCEELIHAQVLQSRS